MSELDIKNNFPSSLVSYYKVGGLCKYFFVADDEQQIIQAVEFSKNSNIVSRVLVDNNFIVADAGYNGLLILKKEEENAPKCLFKSVDYSSQMVNLNIKNTDDKKISSDFFIKEAGLIGKSIGSWKIAGNGIVMIEKIDDKASVDHFLQLVSYIKQQVRDQFLVQLEEEFIYVY